MAISDIDIKLLWGKSGGICSAPDCSEDLTVFVSSKGYLIGEMAHVIGKRPTARRGTSEGGADTYENLILLCPTHHTHIDKAPEGTFPEEMLYAWKQKHEALRDAIKTKRFSTFEKLKETIFGLLAESRAIFISFGPKSAAAIESPESNAFLIWELRRLTTILPNNRSILRLIDSHTMLIPQHGRQVIEEFRAHALAYEHHVLGRLDSYPLFPTAFAKLFQPSE